MVLARSVTDFIREMLRTLRHPGPPPPHWAWLAPGIVLSCAALLAALLLAQPGMPERHHLFYEGHPGTFISVGYLIVDGAACLLICRMLAHAGDSCEQTQRLMRCFAVVLALVVVGAVLMFWFGTTLHDRQHYYFSKHRLGRPFWFAVLAAVALGAWICCALRRCRFARFWLLFGSLLCWLALDDLLGFHEDAAKWIYKNVLHLPRDHPVAFHLNDALVVCYGLAAIGLAWSYRHWLVRLPWMLLTMSPAVLFFLGTLFADFTEFGEWQEEGLKVLAGAGILAALVTAYLEIRRDRHVFVAPASTPENEIVHTAEGR